MEPIAAIQHVNIIRHILQDDGTFPNNGLLPLLIYQKALQIPAEKASETVISLFEINDWVNAWVDGVYDYHHYHSTAHEVLGVLKGSARIQFGGPNGVSQLVEQGDVVIIPAGVAHNALDLYDDFSCVGAYPSGQDYDILQGKAGEREKALENLKNVSLPISDPVYGTEGPLLTNWNK